MVNSLKKLLQPGDLELIRSKIFGKGVDIFPRNEQSIKTEEEEERKREEKLFRKVVERQELEKLKSRALRDDIKTILDPGQLSELKESGIWSLTRVKKSEGTDPSSGIYQLLRRLLAK